eukprot:scaffold8017_cov21-Tisochrysis_lutea.AAC.1
MASACLALPASSSAPNAMRFHLETKACPPVCLAAHLPALLRRQKVALRQKTHPLTLLRSMPWRVSRCCTPCCLAAQAKGCIEAKDPP